MSILHITNLTDNPVSWITDKYLDAFQEIEKDFNISISDDNKNDFIESQIDQLEDYMNESKGSELLSIVDNYLVNEDYYSNIKDYFVENN